MGPEIPYPSPVNRLTDTCENITLTQLLLGTVKIDMNHKTEKEDLKRQDEKPPKVSKLQDRGEINCPHFTLNYHFA